MNSELTQFELDVLDATLKQHASCTGRGYKFTTLRVARRELSGVGAYIVLERDGQSPLQAGTNDQLGFTGELKVWGVPSGLGAVVDVESGQLNHIEFFTYGDEAWDGDTSQGVVIPDSVRSRLRRG